MSASAAPAAARRGSAPGALVRFLVGKATRAQLTPAARAAIARDHALIEADTRAFAAYEPSLPPAATDPVPVICTLGERSNQIRREAAERLSTRAGAPIVLVPGSGHLCPNSTPRRDSPS